MPKRISNKRPEDLNGLPNYLVNRSSEEDTVNTALPSKEQISVLMAAMGRKGGRIGGKRRLETMTAHERRAVAKKAAQARWHRKEK